jgi:hypothetical protein
MKIVYYFVDFHSKEIVEIPHDFSEKSFSQIFNDMFYIIDLSKQFI